MLQHGQRRSQSQGIVAPATQNFVAHPTCMLHALTILISISLNFILGYDTQQPIFLHDDQTG